MKKLRRISPIFRLSMDIFNEIFEYLDQYDCLCISATCRVFNKIVFPSLKSSIRYSIILNEEYYSYYCISFLNYWYEQEAFNKIIEKIKLVLISVANNGIMRTDIQFLEEEIIFYMDNVTKNYFLRKKNDQIIVEGDECKIILTDFWNILGKFGLFPIIDFSIIIKPKFYFLNFIDYKKLNMLATQSRNNIILNDERCNDLLQFIYKGFYKSKYDTLNYKVLFYTDNTSSPEIYYTSDNYHEQYKPSIYGFDKTRNILINFVIFRKEKPWIDYYLKEFDIFILECRDVDRSVDGKRVNRELCLEVKYTKKVFKNLL